MTPISTDLSTDPSIVALVPARDALLAQTSGLVIRSPEGFSEWALRLKDIKASLAEIEAARVRITEPLNASLREVNRQAKESSAPFLQAEIAIKAAAVIYFDEQNRIARDKQRELDETARRARQKITDDANERARKANEAAVALRKEQDAALAAGRASEAAKLAARAEKQERKADDTIAKAEDRAATIVAPVAQSAKPAVQGVSVRKVWQFEIVDARQISAAFMVPDEVKIRKQVMALGADAGALIGAGVRIYQTSSMAAGSR